MCGIAGLIHRDQSADIGGEMTRMLQSLRHRGPDSTGFGLFGGGDDPLHAQTVETLGLSDMAQNYLRQKNIRYVGELVQRTEKEVRHLLDIGKETLAEIGAALKKHGLTLGDGGDGKVRIMRLKTAEQEETKHGFRIHEQIIERREAIKNRLAELGVEVLEMTNVTEYAMRVCFKYAGDIRRLADYLEDIDGVEILSIGAALELVKDLGDAAHVSSQYGLADFRGTHAIGHTRMATESAVDIRSAHPYWAYPFYDIAVVHNGQLTNYWTFRRTMERRGHRFVSDCDSELLAVYVADRMAQGDDLESALRRSVDELDGVFTYIVATADALGMAKDVMAAKPLVLYESDNFIAMASEEVAIRAVFPHEIDTVDPFEGEVRTWQMQ